MRGNCHVLFRLAGAELKDFFRQSNLHITLFPVRSKSVAMGERTTKVDRGERIGNDNSVGRLFAEIKPKGSFG